MRIAALRSLASIQMADNCGLGNWGGHMDVAHAISPNVTGPYVKTDTALPVQATNPQVNCTHSAHVRPSLANRRIFERILCMSWNRDDRSLDSLRLSHTHMGWGAKRLVTHPHALGRKEACTHPHALGRTGRTCELSVLLFLLSSLASLNCWRWAPCWAYAR